MCECVGGLLCASGNVMFYNMFCLLRSAFWTKDGRWRQWEALDCVNIGVCAFTFVVFLNTVCWG